MLSIFKKELSQTNLFLFLILIKTLELFFIFGPQACTKTLSVTNTIKISNSYIFHIYFYKLNELIDPHSFLKAEP